MNLPEEETLKRKASAEKVKPKRAKLETNEMAPEQETGMDLAQPKKTPARTQSAKEKAQIKAAAGTKPITSFFKKK